MANSATPTLTKLADAVAAGTISVPITRTYRLDEAPQALSDFAAGHYGKLAIGIHA
jgi:NADPH2:quinone reductase